MTTIITKPLTEGSFFILGSLQLYPSLKSTCTRQHYCLYLRRPIVFTNQKGLDKPAILNFDEAQYISNHHFSVIRYPAYLIRCTLHSYGLKRLYVCPLFLFALLPSTVIHTLPAQEFLSVHNARYFQFSFPTFHPTIRTLLICRMARSQSMSSKKALRNPARERASVICPLVSNFSLTVCTEPSTLTVSQG